MPEIPVHLLPVDLTCPVCREVQDAAVGIDTPGRPQPGDAALCWSCLALLQYVGGPPPDALSLVPAVLDDLDPECRVILLALRDAARRFKAEDHPG